MMTSTPGLSLELKVEYKLLSPGQALNIIFLKAFPAMMYLIDEYIILISEMSNFTSSNCSRITSHVVTH